MGKSEQMVQGDKYLAEQKAGSKRERLSGYYVLFCLGSAFLLPELQNLYRSTFIGAHIILILASTIFLVLGAVYYVFRGMWCHKDYFLNAFSLSFVFITLFLWVNFSQASSDGEIERYSDFEFGVQGRQRAKFGIPHFEIERRGLTKKIYFKEWSPEAMKSVKEIYLHVKEGYFGFDIIVSKQAMN